MLCMRLCLVTHVRLAEVRKKRHYHCVCQLSTSTLLTKRNISCAHFLKHFLQTVFKFVLYFHDEGARMRIVSRASNVDICLNSDKSRLRGYKIHNVATSSWTSCCTYLVFSTEDGHGLRAAEGGAAPHLLPAPAPWPRLRGEDLQTLARPQQRRAPASEDR